MSSLAEHISVFNTCSVAQAQMTRDSSWYEPCGKTFIAEANIDGGVSFSCRSTGMPSPLSPMPSPAGSVSSQPGSNASNCGGNSISSSVTIPYNIPSITSSYVNITSYILYAYDIWEQADALARKNKGKVFSLWLFCLAHCVYLHVPA